MHPENLYIMKGDLHQTRCSYRRWSTSDWSNCKALPFCSETEFIVRYKANQIWLSISSWWTKRVKEQVLVAKGHLSAKKEGDWGTQRSHLHPQRRQLTMNSWNQVFEDICMEYVIVSSLVLHSSDCKNRSINPCNESEQRRIN